MKLSSFSVNNYRSITNARKIQTNNLTVLVGKNNEGKSNILRALSLAMELMKAYASDPRELRFSSNRSIRGQYKWDRDYPISLQERNPNGSSSIDLIFDLAADDISAIREMTGIRLSGSIPVRVSINASVAKLDIPKRGTQAFSNIVNKKRIIDYVCSKTDFLFIPAVRTEQEARNVVEALIEDQLGSLESNPEYMEAVKTIVRLQQEMLDSIANRLMMPLKVFLPSVKDVRIQLLKGRRFLQITHNNTEIIINDGKPTPIQQKGDGIKSLVALAMLNTTSKANRMSVIAIEEPESHLHPESARQLFETIVALTPRHQVVLTTHSPIFINRDNLCENIIVDSGKANPAKRIKDIRDVLGTKVSDNLINAETVLIVEGENDRIALQKLLPCMSEKISTAIQKGNLVIDEVRGVGNLPFKLTIYRNLQCKYHVLLDNDEAGREAGSNAEKEGLLNSCCVTYTICNGSPNAEFEDYLNPKAYKEKVKAVYGVDLDVPSFRCNKKWSERMSNCFKSQGKQWNESIEKQVKQCVADAIPAEISSLDQHKRSSLDALVKALEEMV